VDANDLSRKEATAMSREIKYIGMDVYQEAIVIAVLNGSGKIAEQNPLTWICSHRQSQTSASTPTFRSPFRAMFQTYGISCMESWQRGSDSH